MSDTFDLNSGGGNPSFSFGPQGAQPGAHVAGNVVDMAEVQQINFDTKKPETWDNGDPKMQIRLTLQTELRDAQIPNDTGIRDVYLRGKKRPHDNGAKSTICAVLDAVRAATGDTKLARGGRVTLQWVSGMGFSGDPRSYQASYQPPAMDLGGQAAAPVGQAPVQQYAAPVQVAPPVQVAQQVPAPAGQTYIQTDQGVVDTATGQVVQAPAAAPAQAAAPVSANGYSPEQEAALRAAGLDPAVVAAQANQAG